MIFYNRVERSVRIPVTRWHEGERLWPDAPVAGKGGGRMETGRRPPGALENAVLTVLWQAGAALTAGEVRDALAGPLSYSTVVTILSRLHDKGLLARQREDGRAFRYRPVTDEPGLAARRMHQALTAGPDRGAVLSHFVSDLTADDEVLLRELLGDRATGDGEPG
jgi:predicted transcriptional regulator